MNYWHNIQPYSDVRMPDSFWMNQRILTGMSITEPEPEENNSKYLKDEFEYNLNP